MSPSDPSEVVPEDGRETIETEYGTIPPSLAIVAAIAEVQGVDPSETDFVLHDSIDPDALDRIFGEDRQYDVSEVRTVAEFDVDGYRVEIRNDGNVTVRAPD